SWDYLIRHGFHQDDVKAICRVRHQSELDTFGDGHRVNRLQPGDEINPKILKHWESSKVLFLDLDPPYCGQHPRRIKVERTIVYPALVERDLSPRDARRRCSVSTSSISATCQAGVGPA